MLDGGRGNFWCVADKIHIVCYKHSSSIHTHLRQFEVGKDTAISDLLGSYRSIIQPMFLLIIMFYLSFSAFRAVSIVTAPVIGRCVG